MTDNRGLNVTSATPAEVPAFTCLIYICKQEDEVRGRCANLEGIEASGASEREVLAKLVPMFRQRISQWMQDGTAIPWIDPPSELRPDEQKRILPVHL